jgi:hypothetical protein
VFFLRNELRLERLPLRVQVEQLVFVAGLQQAAQLLGPPLQRVALRCSRTKHPALAARGVAVQSVEALHQLPLHIDGATVEGSVLAHRPQHLQVHGAAHEERVDTGEVVAVDEVVGRREEPHPLRVHLGFAGALLAVQHPEG